MKRTLILLLASGMLLAGCNCPFAEQPAQNDDEIAGFVGNKLNGDHLTYLVLSKVGRYSGGDVVAKDDTLFLENFIKFTGAPGTDLPGKDAITASSGAEFVSWVSYDGTGALTEHDKVPAQSGKILYAYFKGTGGSPTPGPGPTPDPSGEYETIDTKYGIRNVTSGKYLCSLTLNGKDLQDRDQAQALGVNFKAGTEVQLYDTENNAGWIVNIEGWSFGGASATDTKYLEYLTPGASSWTVVKDFTADIYAKFAMGNDEIYFGLK